MRNLSEKYQGFWLSHLLDGHTYQELLDMQGEPGEYFPSVSWIETALRRFVELNEPSDYVYTFYLNKVGEWIIAVDNDYEPSLWFCGSFQVVEAPSE